MPSSFLVTSSDTSVCEVTPSQEESHRSSRKPSWYAAALPVRVCPLVRVLPPFCAVSLSAFSCQHINLASRYLKQKRRRCNPASKKKTTRAPRIVRLVTARQAVPILCNLITLGGCRGAGIGAPGACYVGEHVVVRALERDAPLFVAADFFTGILLKYTPIEIKRSLRQQAEEHAVP